MVETDIREIPNYLVLAIGIVLVSNGLFRVPRIPYEGVFFIGTGVFIFGYGISTAVSKR